MKGSRLWVYLTLGAIALCVLVVAAGFLYAAYASPESRAAAPNVEITGTEPKGDAPVGQPVVVFAEAHDPAGITRAELWVNGAETASQNNPNPSAQLPFEISSAWIPTGAGEYLMVMKAVNASGAIGESVPVVIHVGERSFEPDPALQGEYLVREGDTWESIAEGLDIPIADLRALNPDVDEPVPGSSLHVPPRPEDGEGTEAGGDAGDGAAPADLADIPTVDLPVPAPPPGGESRDAAPRTDDELFGLPMPGLLLCTLRPELCRIPIDGVPPPTRPDGVTTGVPGTGCGVDVFWHDNSENETGFRVYRFTSRPRFRMDLLELFGPTAGTGSVLHYLDADPPRGTFFYAVTAYNAGGDTWSPPSPTHTSEGCGEEGEVATVVVEALSLEVPGSFDRLYCYASLADSPFERVPHGVRSFITLGEPGTLDEGRWNIAEHFSGSNKRSVLVNRLGPLNLVVECLGWQGGELVNLGRFRREHGPADWDGRTLSATSDSGGFSVSYRINYSFRSADEGGDLVWPVVDPDFPAPFDLHETDSFEECRRIIDTVTCVRPLTGAALAWDYPSMPDPEGSPVPWPFSYIVYVRLEGEATPREFSRSWHTRTARLSRATCSNTAYYSVSAVVGIDPVTHEQIQSRLSEELMVPPACAALEITLEPLWVYGVDDGDFCTIFTDCRDDYESYGWMTFNAHRIGWNAHCDPGLGGGCVRATPSYNVLLEASEHDWANMWLNHGDGWRRDNHVFRIPIHDGQALTLVFQFWDHDAHSADDLWCGMPAGRSHVLASARSAAEWLSFDQELVYDDNCILRVRARGVPGG